MGRALALSWPSLGAMRWLGAALSLCSILVLAVLLAGAGWEELLRPLAAASWGWMVAAGLLALSVEVVKTVRWQLLLGMGPALLPRMLALVFNARVINALAPLRAGDLWRLAFVARSEQRSLVTAGASIAAEKILDAVGLAAASGMLIMLAGTRISSDSPPLLLVGGWGAWAYAAGVALLCIGAAALGACYLAARWGLRSLLDPALTGDDSRGGTGAVLAEHLAEAARRGLAPLRGWTLVYAAGLTVVGLGLGFAVNVAVLEALEFPRALEAALVMLLSGYAAGLIPSGPGHVGVYELTVSAALVAAGFTPSAALAAAVCLHLVLLAALGIGGLLSVPLGLASSAR